MTDSLNDHTDKILTDWKKIQKKIKNSDLLKDLSPNAAYSLALENLLNLEDFSKKTKKEVADLSGVSYATVRTLLDKGVVFKEPEKNAWVISVKLGKGCYRHLKVPKTKTLSDFADIILWSFEFVNDHAHAFFMDNKAWSQADAYYLAGFSDDGPERYTENVSLEILKVKQKFVFVFDFGDDWRFSCTVLREVVDSDGEAYEIKCVGEPPEQYPFYNEDGWS